MLGDGSQGAATLMRDPKSGRCVACKKVCVSGMEGSALVQLEREVCTLRQMSHINIIQYLGSYQIGDTLCILTEHAAGDTLARKVSVHAASAAPFASGRLLRWLRQLTSALEHVHSAKVLHRDVKARNVFLSASDDIRLGDFGLAQQLPPGVDLAQSYCGTPMYLSPEMATGRPYGAPSDVWGLGIVLYELLTLVRPFRSASLVQLTQCSEWHVHGTRAFARRTAAGGGSRQSAPERDDAHAQATPAAADARAFPAAAPHARTCPPRRSHTRRVRRADETEPGAAP